ncbi:hypothetical protein GW17_00061449 [Ensete ventricosum]|nr:hypothetical protein GW17_00061449 [Ensete ventricosum]
MVAARGRAVRATIRGHPVMDDTCLWLGYGASPKVSPQGVTSRPRPACKESMPTEASPTGIGSTRPQGRHLQALRPSAHWSIGDYRRGDHRQRIVLSLVQGRRRQQRSEGKG